MANVNIRIDQDIKKKAEAIFKGLGITPTTAITMFYIQTIRNNGIPFVLKLETPNAETLEAIKEVEEMEQDPSKRGRIFNNVDELMEDLNNGLLRSKNKKIWKGLWKMY